MKTKKYLMLLVFCVVFFILMKGYAAKPSAAPAADNLPDFIEKLKRTAVLILATEQRIVIGTGFLATDEKKQVLVVTNAHIAKIGKPIFVRVNAPDKTIDYFAELYKINEAWDIAVLVLKKITPDQQWVSTDLIVSIGMLGNSSDIVEGKEIIYIGYPLGLGAEEKNYPVSRQGLIAQVVKNRATFLIDGFASHGNSGSPVFSRKDAKLLGMIISFEPDFIDSFDNKKLMLRIPFNSGISKVVSAEAIRAVLVDKK